jgi:hypothetical protein
MQLIKAGWITLKENLNVSTNSLPNHASGSGSVNALEAEFLGNLKEPMARARCKEGSVYARGCP